jgi:hypothetical protein
MLVGVEQAVEVETRRPLVPGLEDRFRVVQADPPDVLGEIALCSRRILRCGAQPAVGFVDLLDERVAGYRRLLYSGVLPVRTS